MGLMAAVNSIGRELLHFPQDGGFEVEDEVLEGLRVLAELEEPDPGRDMALLLMGMLGAAKGAEWSYEIGFQALAAAKAFEPVTLPKAHEALGGLTCPQCGGTQLQVLEYVPNVAVDLQTDVVAKVIKVNGDSQETFYDAGDGDKLECTECGEKSLAPDDWHFEWY